MTADLVVTSGCASQVGWSGTQTFNIGSVHNERETLDPGLEVISQTLGKATDSKAYNFLGQKRTFNITGTYSNDSATELRNFTNNLKLIADWQLQGLSETVTFTYQNTNSRIKDVYNGVQVMMSRYSIDSTADDGPGMVNYSMELVETSGSV
jgi:hypothetical protein